MKRVNKLFFTVALLAFAGIASGQNNSFYVRFEQNGHKISNKDGKVELKKEPFKMLVEYIGQAVDLKVHISTHPKVYKRLKEGKLVRETTPFSQERKDAENFFSQEKILSFDSEESYFLWKKDKSRIYDKDRATASKNVEKIQLDGKILSLSEMPKNTYLTFVYTEPDNSGGFVEVQRETIVLRRVKAYQYETQAYRKSLERRRKAKAKEEEKQRKQEKKIEEKDKKRIEKLERNKSPKEK